MMRRWSCIRDGDAARQRGDGRTAGLPAGLDERVRRNICGCLGSEASPFPCPRFPCHCIGLPISRRTSIRPDHEGGQGNEGAGESSPALADKQEDGPEAGHVEGRWGRGLIFLFPFLFLSARVLPLLRKDKDKEERERSGGCGSTMPSAPSAGGERGDAPSVGTKKHRAGRRGVVAIEFRRAVMPRHPGVEAAGAARSGRLRGPDR
jgi:hypothetical protein